MQVSQKTITSDTDNWRSSNPSTAPAAAGTNAAGGNTAAATGATNTASANVSAAARHAASTPAPGPALGMLRAEDVGRQKWQPAKGLESSAQAQQKLRGILNKLTPDNFDRLLTQVRSRDAHLCTEMLPAFCRKIYTLGMCFERTLSVSHLVAGALTTPTISAESYQRLYSAFLSDV